MVMIDRCKQCGAEAQLENGWCNVCKNNYPREFKLENPMWWVNNPNLGKNKSLSLEGSGKPEAAGTSCDQNRPVIYR
jgi:hypothetical protein